MPPPARKPPPSPALSTRVKAWWQPFWKANKPRPVAVVAAAGVLVSGIIVTAYAGRRLRREAPLPAPVLAAASARAARQTPVLDVPPAPTPIALPLVGPEGRDRDDYPTQYVDGPAFRRLLLDRAYAELNLYFDRLQTSFEADHRAEYWPLDAADAFASADPLLREMLDGWVTATPDHFAPYLARATHLVDAGYTARGTAFTKDTPEGDFAAMNASFTPALADIDRALVLRPKLVAAHRQAIKIAMASRRGSVKASADAALAICPSCFQVRATQMFGTAPRWGGNEAAMRDIARTAPVGANRRLRLLAGYVDLEQAKTQRGEGRLDEARITIERACALGDHADFLQERAHVRHARRELPGALADLDRALELRPGLPDLLRSRVRVHLAASHPDLAAKDLLGVLRISSTGSETRDLLGTVVKNLVYESWQRDRAGDRQEALRLIDLAAGLAPNDPEVIRRRNAYVVQSSGTSPSDLVQLEQNARDAPDDFRAHQQLDYALARQRQFGRIVEMWNAYLLRNPNDARAYFERAGTYHHLGRPTERQADFTKACELGSVEGCAAKKRFGAAP